MVRPFSDGGCLSLTVKEPGHATHLVLHGQTTLPYRDIITLKMITSCVEERCGHARLPHAMAVYATQLSIWWAELSSSPTISWNIYHVQLATTFILNFEVYIYLLHWATCLPVIQHLAAYAMIKEYMEILGLREFLVSVLNKKCVELKRCSEQTWTRDLQHIQSTSLMTNPTTQHEQLRCL